MIPRDQHEQLVEQLKPDVQRAMRTPLHREPITWMVLALVIVVVSMFAIQQHEISAKNRDIHDLSRQVVTLGGTPVAGPSGLRGAQGPTGRAPSSAEISAAVTAYCADHDGCTGTPSPEDVAIAVRAFCSAGGCRGAAGAPGSPGRAGASGKNGAPGATGASGAPGGQGAKGETGPGPTAAQIAAAVGAYCSAHGDCTGPAGPPGAAGRGIASLDCTGLGVDQLTVHYDDGTDQTVPCNTPTTTTPSGAATP